MSKITTLYVGLDVHKDSIEIGTADGTGGGEVRHVGRVGGDMASLDRAVRSLNRPTRSLIFVYEAGPCGYAIYRHLTSRGFTCQVVAPSMTPRRPGERIKTDRRDCLKLARLGRAGELTIVHIPDARDEAIRDLSRARGDAVRNQRDARHRLKALLLRHDIRYAGKTAWTQAHESWLARVKLPHPAQQIVFQEYLDSVRESTQRIARLTQALTDAVIDWRWQPVVAGLQTLRGIALVNAVTLVAEIGDIQRFSHPRHLMAYLGLVPGEHSSGSHRRQGSITKTGNCHARRALIEAAWQYRLPARITPIIAKRQAGIPEPIRALAWKAQLRLCTRFRRLTARQLHPNKIVVAMARELTGFVWAVVRETRVSMNAAPLY